MAGEIQEPFQFNFQADLLHSGSISFGRFESESLSWERRSIFSHNRYLEEVEKCSKPGSVTEKKAYFEAHFRRKALLKQSSECQDGRESSRSENGEANGVEESDNGNDNRHYSYLNESPHCTVSSRHDEETEVQEWQKENVGAPHGSEESDDGNGNGNGNGNGLFAYIEESPHRSVPLGYDEATNIQKYQKENMAVLLKSPHSSGYNEDSTGQTSEYVSVKHQDEPLINLIGHPVGVPEHVKLVETYPSETENAVLVNTEESKTSITGKVEKVDVESEVHDSPLPCYAAEKNDDSANVGCQQIFSSKVRPAPDKKQSKPMSRAQADFARLQKTVSSEASKGSLNPRISESEGLLRKKTEKMSPRPASPFTRSGLKTSKTENSSMNVSEAKMLHAKKSIMKELSSEKAVKTQLSASEKSRPGIRQAANRLEQIVSPSKPHVIRSAAGYNFKSDQRSESRKEEKTAAGMKQSRKSLDFNATPVPSSCYESARSFDRYKVIPMSKTPPPHQPCSPLHPAVTRSHKVAFGTCVKSITKLSSSTSSTTGIRPLEARPSSSGSRARPWEARPSSSGFRARPWEARPSSSGSRARPLEARPSSSSSRTRPLEARPSSSGSRAHPLESRPRSSSSRTRPLEARPSSSSSRTVPLESRPSSAATRNHPLEKRPSSSTAKARPLEGRPSSSTARTRPLESRPSCAAISRPSSSSSRTRPSEVVRKSQMGNKKD